MEHLQSLDWWDRWIIFHPWLSHLLLFLFVPLIIDHKNKSRQLHLVPYTSAPFPQSHISVSECELREYSPAGSRRSSAFRSIYCRHRSYNLFSCEGTYEGQLSWLKTFASLQPVEPPLVTDDGSSGTWAEWIESAVVRINGGENTQAVWEEVVVRGACGYYNRPYGERMARTFSINGVLSCHNYVPTCLWYLDYLMMQWDL